MIFRRRRTLNAALFALVVAVFFSVSSGAEPASDLEKPVPEKSVAKPSRKNFKLPGLVVDFQKRYVDIEATVCLDEGMLELIACTKETKEHESIVTIAARPMHVHTALLLLGANNGHPAMRRSVSERGTRCVDIPPRGDPVDVYLIFRNNEGKVVEHPISDFVARCEEHLDVLVGADKGNAQQGDKKSPKTFLFAGSLLHGDGPGPRQYLADRSGNVISIVTFGDELLCLPGIRAKANDALMWQIEATKLPKFGSKVTHRLRPPKKPAAKTDNVGVRGTANDTETSQN